MPGTIKLVHVEAGDSVKKNMPLAVMEAMKMEHTLKAPRDGIIEQRFVEEGDQVEEGVILLELQPI
jgi:3-methylcrotonyl-CoA carboxylase alpha subunit